MSVFLNKQSLMYPTVYNIGMTQKNGKESLEDFVKRSQDDSLKKIHDLMRHTDQAMKSSHDSGLTLASFGSQISTEEGKLEILRMVDYLIDDKKNW